MSISLETFHKWHLLDGQGRGVCVDLGSRASLTEKKAESAWGCREVGITVRRGDSEGDSPPGM